MEILKINVGDIVELKKPHPCGNKSFEILRTGSEVRIVCLSCKRDMTLDRIKLEKAIKRVLPKNQAPKTACPNEKQK